MHGEKSPVGGEGFAAEGLELHGVKRQRFFAQHVAAFLECQKRLLGVQERGCGYVDEIQGRRRTWFCGAWTGYGFHEDGLRSARKVAEALGASHRYVLRLRYVFLTALLLFPLLAQEPESSTTIRANVPLVAWEDVVDGNAIDETIIAKAEAAASASVDPRDDIHASGAYRKALLGVMVERALRSAAE